MLSAALRTRIAAFAALAACSAWAADGRIEFLSRQLDRATDPRARAQACLLLGASNDHSAIAPLCGGLGDASELVRSACAKAMGQLADPSSLECLKRHGGDTNPEVRDLVQRALAVLDRQQTRSGLGAVYVFVSPVLDKEDRPNAGNVRMVDERLRAALTTLGVNLAPVNETKAQATAVIRAGRLKGFVVNPELSTHAPAGLKLSLLVLTYPDRSILGEVSVKASGAGASELIRALAPKVVEEAADTFDWSR
jgi:hypothetical protein